MAAAADEEAEEEEVAAETIALWDIWEGELVLELDALGRTVGAGEPIK